MFEIDVSHQIGARSIALAFSSEAHVTALVGASGAGKTSVLNMIAGLVRPDRGRISVDGRTLFDASAGVDLPPEQRRCGYVFQDDRLFPHRTVRQNLLYGAARAGGAGYRTTIEEVVALLGLQTLLTRRPATLSGGEAKRVAIGRALLSRPDFLLLDEPLSSIDAPRRDTILAAIARIKAEVSLPILLVSHRAEEVERAADVVVAMPG